MKLEFEDAVHCAKVFEDYFGNFDRIDEYMRDQKLNSLAELPSNPLFPIEDELFQNFTMDPKDMNFEVVEIDNETWTNLLNITSSHVNIPPVGRNVKLAVRETNTGKYVGFIRLGSPVINCKPRNDMLGQVFTQQPEWGKRFNNSAMMGFVIVPAQPFGYNYLGGKLLAAICDFLPMMHGKPYSDLRDFVQDKVGPLVEEDASSKKLKISMKIISLTKAALKGTPEGDTFIATIEKAKGLTEQKRYYISDYGFSNMIDYVNCKTDVLIPGENYEKHSLVNLIEWWRKKACNRYETLYNDNRLKTELEIWTSGKEIQIIR